MQSLIDRIDYQQLIQSGIEAGTNWGFKILGALAVLLIGRWFAGRVRKVLGIGFQRAEVDPILAPFLTALLFYLVMAFIAISALGIVGIPVSSFVAVLGAAGLAIGLAFRDTLSNFAAGAMLLTFRPFKVGDFVEAAGVSGTIQHVGIFSAVVRRGDNVVFTVPNSKIWGDSIANYNALPTRRIDLLIGIGYDDDIAKAFEIIETVLAEDERVLQDPPPVLGVHELGDSSVNLVVRPWCTTENYWSLRWHLTRTIKERLEAGGCSIPFPQRDLHLVSGGPLAVA
jgi:small conductance mechanosensitive channel